MIKYALSVLFVIGAGAAALFATHDHFSSPTVAFEQSIKLTPEARPGESLGTVFEIEAEGVRCAAGYVNSVQTRIYANQNHLEFWCREDSEAVDLKFQSIGKKRPTNFRSSIMNHRGRLFDIVSEAFWDGSEWSILKERKHIRGGRVINLQTRGGKDYWFVLKAAGCKGVSLFSDDGYHGTYAGEGRVSWSALYTDGDVIVANLGHKMMTGPVPAPDQSKGCRDLPLSVFDDRYIWSYVIMPHDGRVFYGAPAEAGKCAPLATFDGTKVRSLPPRDCKNREITEYYSITPSRDGLYYGNYPIGTLWASSSSSKPAFNSSVAPPLPDDVTVMGVNGRPRFYRESQAVVTTYGSVLVGMFPWGELIAYDYFSKKESVTRVFSAPVKDGVDMTPYTSPMRSIVHEAAQKMLGKKVSLGHVPRRIYKALREQSLIVEEWAQRIPTIAVFSGKVCASTGSHAGHTYEPDKHPMTAAEAASYGEVHCAELRNHVMANEPCRSWRAALRD